MSTLNRLFSCALALSAALHASSPVRDSTAPERWSQLADTVFLQVAQNAALPNAAIPTVFSEDRNGFLWVGTQNGLARWDGYSFRVYKSESSTLPDNYITALYTDGEGVLWIGTSSGGLAKYNQDQDSFTVYAAGPGGLSHIGIVALADDGEQGLWVATEDALDHLHPKTGSISHVRHRAGDPRSLPANRILSLLRDRSGNLWVGTSCGLVRSEGSSQHFLSIKLTQQGAEVPGVSTLTQDSAGRIWIGTTRHGAFVVAEGSILARPVLQTEPGDQVLATEQIHAIAEARSGEIWIGTYGQGIVTVDMATMQTKRLLHDPRMPESLANNDVWAIHQDKSGLVWVATDRSISSLDPRQSAISTLFGSSSRALGISDESVHFVLPLTNGKLWLGLDTNGIDIIDPDGLRIGRRQPDMAHPNTALPRAYIDAAAITTGDEVYLGTPRGFYRAHQSSAAVQRLPLPHADIGAEIWALLVDKEVLWIGGPDGLDQLDLRAGPSAPVHAVMVDQLTDRRVDVIEKGPPGQLWIGTENGVNRMDIASHVVERILPDQTDPYSLLSGFVNTLLIDKRGRLWVGTVGGISVLIARDTNGRPRFHRLGMADGLPNNNIDKLLEDSTGTIWVSTDNGVASINPDTFAVRPLSRADGVVITSYWTNSGALTAKGEVLFGGIGGLTVIRPSLIKPWTYRPPVVVTSVRIGGKLIPSSSFNSSDPAPLTISPDLNNIVVEFSALDYSAPERCRYAYQMDGYDPAWIETDATHRQAAYTNLPPGSYVLRIRGSNRDGLWTEKTVALKIHVQPSWYQTLWLKFTLLLAGITVITLFVRGRTIGLLRRQRKLELSVAQRTAELEESQKQMERFAYFDFLTGLPNRRMFTDDFSKLLSQTIRREGRFALVLIDLNSFKQINDTYGHDAGDALLIEVGVRLRRVVRQSDSVARLGGDEFAILLADDHDPEAVAQVCQRIVESFTLAVPFESAELKASLCIGIALFPDHGRTQDGLYKKADVALYDAKRANRGTTRLFPPSQRKISEPSLLALSS